jgi:hypothetical protein
MYWPFDDVLTSNTSKYIQIIRPVKSGCIGEIWMYYICIEDVSDVLDVFILYLACIVLVFSVYFDLEFIDSIEIY